MKIVGEEQIKRSTQISLAYESADHIHNFKSKIFAMVINKSIPIGYPTRLNILSLVIHEFIGSNNTIRA